MKVWLKTAAGALLIGLMSASPASALCLLGICIGGGGSTGGGGSSGGTSASVPEFDGPGGIAAATLLVSVGLLLYNRARR